jgi:hypothetical protein
MQVSMKQKLRVESFFLGVLIVFILLKVGNKNIDVPPSA